MDGRAGHEIIMATELDPVGVAIRDCGALSGRWICSTCCCREQASCCSVLEELLKMLLTSGKTVFSSAVCDRIIFLNSVKSATKNAKIP